MQQTVLLGGGGCLHHHEPMQYRHTQRTDIMSASKDYSKD